MVIKIKKNEIILYVLLIWKYLYDTFLTGKSKVQNNLCDVLLCDNESMYTIIHANTTSEKFHRQLVFTANTGRRTKRLRSKKSRKIACAFLVYNYNF